MFSIKPGPRNLPIDNPTLLSWNITDGDLNSKLNTLEYLNCITNIINSPDTTYRELNKAAQRSITAPDRIGERKT